MRTIIAISAAVLMTTSAVSAADCNPSYNVAGSTTCYTNCNVAAGKKYGVSNWTMDHTSPYFLQSLALMCDQSGSNYGSFMATAGMCMAGCTGDDPELFNTEWANACAWWKEHKLDTCASETTTTKASATTTTKAADTTITTGAAATNTASGTGATTTVATGSTTATAIVAVSTVTEMVTKTKTITKTKTVTAKCPTCTAGHYGLGRGHGYAGACCKDQSDCWESCIKGKCNGPSQSSCKAGYLKKRNGKGPKNTCCETQRDCKESCVKGKCT